MHKPSTSYFEKRAPKKYQEMARKMHSSISARGMLKGSIPAYKRMLSNKLEQPRHEQIDQFNPKKDNFTKVGSLVSPQVPQTHALLNNKSHSRPNLVADPAKMDTSKALRDKKVNFMCRNTEDFLQTEEVDIHGLSNLSDHKIIRFKYPSSKLLIYLQKSTVCI